MELSILSRLVSRLRELETVRREKIVATLHKAIAQTGIRNTPHDEIRMEALARRGFYCALKIGADLKAQGGPEDKGGVPRLCWKELAEQLEAFRQELKFESAIATPTDKDVDHFCTMRVRRRPSLKKGFYLLWALYLLDLEERKVFDDAFFRGLVPSDAMLARPIWLLLARKLNDEAEAHSEPIPFDDVKRPREPVSLRSVTQTFFVHDHHVDRMMQIFRRCVSPTDGNAHLAVYRMRQSLPDELMKSFMVWKPREADKADGDLTSLHIYKGPEHEGGMTRSSPGRVIPLEMGLFIIGGQRAEPMRTTPLAGLRPAPTPFRTLELLFFPWAMLEGSHLFPGLILSQNDKGAPLAGYVCARPVLTAQHEEIGIGSIPIRKLVGTLELDRDIELEAAKTMDDSEVRVEQVAAIYREYGTIAKLADRVVERCNNRPHGWKAPTRFQVDGKGLSSHAIERMLESAFNDVTHMTDSDRAFALLNDLLFAPLSRA